jgi:glycosyltransferase involved in cell wall biosynthesis
MANIVILSYDLAGTTLSDSALIARKLKRDGYGDSDSVLMICRSRRRRSTAVSGSLHIEELSARFKFRPLYDALFIYTAPRIVRTARIRPDRIVVSDFALVWAAACVKYICGGTIELRLNNLPRDLARGRGLLQRWYAATHEYLTRRMVDSYVVINETTRGYLKAIGIPAERIRVQVPDTIRSDLSLIAAAQPGRARARFGIPDGSPLILSVGRLEKEKGFDELLDVFAHSGVEGRLLIAGDGILRDELQERARMLGISDRVVFAGRLERLALWECYTDADAFVLLSRSEALGLVFWEAMYAHVPVIGRPVGGITETIGEDGERGFFWDTPDGPAAFKEKVQRAVRKGADVAAMVGRAKSWVDRAIRPIVLD